MAAATAGRPMLRDPPLRGAPQHEGGL